jgi:hypothetical protein
MNWRENPPVREILKAKLPEPGGGEPWYPSGLPATGLNLFRAIELQPIPLGSRLDDGQNPGDEIRSTWSSN